MEMHNELKRLGSSKTNVSIDIDENGLEARASDSFKLDCDIARHEAPVTRVKTAGKVPTKQNPTEDTRSTTSAKQISTLLQSQKVIDARFIICSVWKVLTWPSMTLQLISSLELENERKAHYAATERMAALTEILKETTLEMNRAIVTQNKVRQNKISKYFHLLKVCSSGSWFNSASCIWQLERIRWAKERGGYLLILHKLKLLWLC